jgi:hypothetical protein
MSLDEIRRKYQLMIQITHENPYSIPIGAIFEYAFPCKEGFVVWTPERNYTFRTAEATAWVK